jgi:hypothetical protein
LPIPPSKGGKTGLRAGAFDAAVFGLPRKRIVSGTSPGENLGSSAHLHPTQAARSLEGRIRRIAGLAQLVEQRFCNENQSGESRGLTSAEITIFGFRIKYFYLTRGIMTSTSFV